METLEVSAKTVEEAIQSALEQLGLRREEVEITILNEGRSGVLGIGAEEARVRVVPLTLAQTADVTQLAKGALESLLHHMGIRASVALQTEPSGEVAPGAQPPIAFNITGEDLGILIGWHGQTLSSLQYLLRLIVAHQTKVWPSVVIDVEGYRQRRQEALRTMARHAAEQVKTKGLPFMLEPMPSYERRIVHLELADAPDVTTESTGEGEARQVVILPKKKE